MSAKLRGCGGAIRFPLTTLLFFSPVAASFCDQASISTQTSDSKTMCATVSSGKLSWREGEGEYVKIGLRGESSVSRMAV